jgi:hypothetical protein
MAMASARQTLTEVRRSVQRFHAEAQRLVAQIQREGAGTTARVRDEAGKLLARVEDRAVRVRKQLHSLESAARNVQRRLRQRVTGRRTSPGA